MPILPPVGSFNITQLCDKADKIGKDTNFRGLTTFNNVLYTTKGNGGNGINTVYFIDTTGKACPTGANRAFLAASAFLKVPQPCRPRGFLMTHRSCRRTAWFPTTCAS